MLQGFHLTMGLMMSGYLPIIPCPEGGRVDVIARDVAAAGIASALDQRLIAFVLAAGFIPVPVPNDWKSPDDLDRWLARHGLPARPRDGELWVWTNDDHINSRLAKAKLATPERATRPVSPERGSCTLPTRSGSAGCGASCPAKPT